MAKKQFGKFTEAEVEAGTRTGTGEGNKKLHQSSGLYDEPGAKGTGQTIRRSAPLDTSDMELPNELGEEGFRGSPTSVEHSLKGASVVDRNEPTGGKRTGWKWPDH